MFHPADLSNVPIDAKEETSANALGLRTRCDRIGIDSVVFGRGGLSNTHRGNRLFRRIVNHNRQTYQGIEDLKTKRLLVDSIIMSIHRIGVKFLRQENGSWVEAAIKVTRRKNAQALRETMVGEESEPTQSDEESHRQEETAAPPHDSTSDYIAPHSKVSPVNQCHEESESEVKVAEFLKQPLTCKARVSVVAFRPATDESVEDDPAPVRINFDDTFRVSPQIPPPNTVILQSTRISHRYLLASEDESTAIGWHPNSAFAPTSHPPNVMDQSTIPADILGIPAKPIRGFELFPSDLLNRVLGPEDSPEQFSRRSRSKANNDPLSRQKNNAQGEAMAF